MSGEKVEGTIVFDGLLQGRLSDESVGEKLREWVAFAGKLGLRFSLEQRVGAFSLLPETQPASVEALGDDPAATIRQSLEQLAAIFPPHDRGQLFSTLRTSEFRPGREVQSVYTAVNGQIGVQSRTLEAQTVAPPKPLSARERAKLAGMGLAMAAAVVGISLLFPGVRALFGQLAETVRPFNVEEVTVELGPYKGFFEYAVDEKVSSRSRLALILKRSPSYPIDDATLAAAAQTAGNDVRRRLAVEALARGWVRYEMFGDDGTFVGRSELRVADLAGKELTPGLILFPEKTRVTKIVFVP